ncbi:halocyanin domain-containing protein [Salinibaculum salinum]|uniref:halocyanin domain-containing protein n=1 Tax=Salinibaculum salinum TaxID=3131996 RepID=UPI0030EEFF63
MSERRATRRYYLRGLGTAGIVGLAGCIAEDETPTDGDDEQAEDDPTPAETPASSGLEEWPDFGGHLAGANNFDGTVVDMTGQDEVTVNVGAGNSGLAFGPAAVHVDNGATVVWEWTGEGGAHNVVAEDETFNSGSPTSSGTYKYTFEEDGVYNYVCVPHEASGMLGALVVGNEYPTAGDPPGEQEVAVDYLADANDYDGFVDARGFDEVTVAVGADNGLAFGPPAIHVDPGTNVSWVWTDKGGAHNVIAENDSFDSGTTVADAGHVYDHKFAERGFTRYYCAPHKGAGMKGVVLVGGDTLDSYSRRYDPSSETDNGTENGGSDDYRQPDFDGYLENANNYDGTLVDMTGQATVEISVGGGETALAFGPAAVHVDTGATVVWEWTGEGGAHNVVAEDETFASGDPVSDVGTTYNFTFEQPGIYTYYCAPHRAAGMKGAIVVGTDHPVE